MPRQIKNLVQQAPFKVRRSAYDNPQPPTQAGIQVEGNSPNSIHCKKKPTQISSSIHFRGKKRIDYKMTS
ncbi:hypothetical protein VNO80_03429 [Phaseolus coccineus]|uniref:Uncharacterized protein n=1 Tax=Phaseolus coccineus TaxID=3886 RepID=A0AAN9NYM7_PHACN